ncbi:uncharacterized protein LOC125470902 [Pyrus x bretschneideri]|uniref:uncharacterized protein LOC125470902 n=1 Tax=Pyrus x bretschneideri TaxID=225117 RepID=UPI0020301016|nr:uncharacterized protein LOC125470902 [Pyrus x bretschneideri]
MKKAMLTIERYQRKHLPSFDDKSSAEASAELRFDIDGLVRKQCFTEFKSWKMVPVDLKNSMVQELLVWDIDETDEKQWKYVDVLFKMQFWQWKFKVHRAAKRARADDAATDVLADDQEEE